MGLSSYILILFIFLSALKSWGFCENHKILLNQAQTQRVLDLGHQIKCPVCRGQPISESNAPIARTILCFIAEEISKNKTDADILKDIEYQFGEAVNLNPALKPETYFLWFIPIFLFLGCGFGCILFLNADKRDQYKT